ncbi:MAG TPA: DUF3768 domain-containing protein [Shinella sp.]|jgi:hypothetical protein|uniref:DUF3768 domain-containing protein n=1 Tax=Shinella sp. TaxID=1870904 RepID=UPI002E0D2EB5|nr:DUF3768 domain-containing protein [Shinella sp.]
MSLPTHKIADLNDLLRTTFLTGKVVLTEGFRALPENVREDVLTQVRCFSDFGPDNDPYGEHDFGSIDHLDAGRVFWKIDYYHEATARVLTIMLASEY